MRLCLICVGSILSLAPCAARAAAPTFGCPATKAQHHQFDFWIGRWEVRDPSGKVVGHSRIESINDGCGISEHWQGTSGANGVSYNAWDPDSKRWHQFWIDNSATTLYLEGGFDRGKMQMLGVQTNAQSGKPQKQRITWSPSVDGSVRQTWDQSDDAGKTWSTTFDGIYRKQTD
jgi:hypothetical protein